MKAIPSIALVSSLALLGACGGGDHDQSTASPIPVPKVAIAAGNQTDVARTTVTSGMAIASTQGSSGGSVAAASSTLRSLGATIHRAMTAVQSRRGIAGAGARAADLSGSATFACSAGGSITTTITDTDSNGQLSSGDVLTLQFSQCADSAATVANGTIVVTLSSVTSADEFTASAKIQDFSVVDVDLTSTIDGDITLTESDSGLEADTTLDVDGTSGLTVTESSSSYDDSIAFVADTRIVTRDTPVSVTVTLDGTFDSSTLGGMITVATLEPVVQLAGDDYPSAGQVRVTGANGSALLVTALSATQVELQLDANGDGNYEGSVDVAWSTLIP